ncbi:sigma-54-dependent Fis family transcriptional regulator [Bacteroidetes/Chlorobi group bacterium Naka2016]|jgi:two-component system NtrC family response regulator|nr:MAG: sigma-54-dependent Fis family transcriptional regulator [Bacteroidetes/Chlorobi group bacterium Naka2016]
MALQNYTILIIEDDPLVNKAIKDVMTKKYSRVFSYLNATEALNDINLISPDLILLDIFLGPHNGLEILEQLRNQGYTVPVIIMTSSSDIKMAVRAMKLGAEDFIVKPIDLEQLEVAVEKALQNYDLRRQVEILSDRLKEEQPSEIIGNCEQLKKVLNLAKIVAATDSTVLIVGETGTGKELLAKFIHRNSPRAKGPFIAINCGAIPKDLAESEFFGYEKGAYTGATEKFKQGRFELANHGTIFLDEISELSLELQVKLLRVLQEKRYFRLGGTKEISVDVRVIASTNRVLEELVEQGKFREDLFYRLNVARLELPPLRERGEDIMLLASAFVKEFNKKFGKNVTGFTPEAVNLLRTYQWKGNIRELRNVIERVVLLEAEDIITKDSLSFLKVGDSQPAIIPSEQNLQELKPGEHKLIISKTGAPMNNVMKDLIIQTLRLVNGNQIKAAKILGISRAKLRYRIEQLGINISGKIVN